MAIVEDCGSELPIDFSRLRKSETTVCRESSLGVRSYKVWPQLFVLIFETSLVAAVSWGTLLWSGELLL